MIKSMTAYGRATRSVAGKNITVEIKSVNNRYFDCNIKMPRSIGFLEEKVRSYVQSNATSRGKVDVFIGVEIIDSDGTLVAVDEAYTKSYIDALKLLNEKFGLKDDISVMSVAQNRDIFRVVKPQEDTDKEWAELEPALCEAVKGYCDMRENEGKRIHDDLLGKKANLERLAGEVFEQSKTGVENYRQRLEAKLRSTLETMAIEPDEQRILTECAIFADKIAIDEELVRLDSHFRAFDEMMESDEPVGRKIDFLIQEMNREVNTTGSKCNDAKIAHMVVDMKAELEKIREQIQNIE